MQIKIVAITIIITNNNNKIEDNNGNKEEKERDWERERAISYYYSTEKIKCPIKQVIDLLFIIRFLLNV